LNQAAILFKKPPIITTIFQRIGYIKRAVITAIETIATFSIFSFTENAKRKTENDL